MALRNVHADIKAALVQNDEFIIAHLIKFEKPIPANTITQGAIDFVYLTDGPFEVSYDSQKYLPNKVLSVGSIKEETLAKAGKTTLKLSATALGASFSDSLTFTTTTVEGTKSFVEQGLQIGDVIEFTGSGANNAKKVRIDSFQANSSSVANAKVTVTNVSGTIGSASASSYTVSASNPEINSLLLNHIGDSTLATFIHRNVEIRRVYIKPTTGAIIGEPFVLFDGYISKGSVSEDVGRGASVNWELTNHWGDFVKIQGRKTSDADHRKLGANGLPDKRNIDRVEYATDYGFEHSERAVNTMATFMGKEKRFKFKKTGFLGLGSGRTIEYDVDVEREVDLRFNLSAKYLPVVYGVRKIDSFPIFADAFKDITEGKVCVNLGLCEGDIGGILDVHVDDQSSVCVDSIDAAARSNTDATFVCQGNMLRGDAIQGFDTIDFSLNPDLTFVSPQLDAVSQQQLSINLQNIEFNFAPIDWGDTPTFISSIYSSKLSSRPVVGPGQSIGILEPTPCSFDVFTGQSEQRASDRLVAFSRQAKFKLQEDYFGNSPYYWTTSHKLLDTAYVVGQFNFSDEDTTIPKYEFVVKGKYVECYDYDNSFTIVSSIISNVDIGDTIQFFENDETTQIGSDTHITDVLALRVPKNRDIVQKNEDRGVEVRYKIKVASAPTLSSSNRLFKFKLSNGSFVAAHTHDVDNTTHSISVDSVAAVTLTAVSVTSDETHFTFSNPNTAFTTGIGHFPFYASNDPYNFLKLHSCKFNNITKGFTYAVGLTTLNAYDSGNSKLKTGFVLESTIRQQLIDDLAAGDNIQMQIPSIILLDENVPSSILSGNKITLTEDATDSNSITQDTFVNYGSTFKNGKYLRLSPFFTAHNINITTNTSVTKTSSPLKSDIRVTTNPAMQLLDYLTNTRYGKGLDIDTEIDFDSFKQAARDCDEQSNVSVQTVSTSTVTVGKTYKVLLNNKLVFQGKVKSVGSNQTSFGTITLKEVEFENVLKKLVHRFSPDRQLEAGTYVYFQKKIYPITTTDGVGYKTEVQFVNAYVTTNKHISNSSITMIDVTDSSNTFPVHHVTESFFATADGNPVIKKFTSSQVGYKTSGYSLYDSDDVKYWRMVGWEEPKQSYVTRHQCNQVINTSTPIFSNVNEMLKQFNGILRYTAGKYTLSVKKDAPAVADTDTISISSVDYKPAKIHKDDIIGNLKVNSAAVKDTFNSVTANIIDPQNKFGARDVNFFNSDYLAQDREIQKQGNVSLTGITNYFNARMQVKQFLDESRGALTVTFKTKPQAALLLSGEFIYLTHEDFGFTDKVFRISNLSLEQDGLVNITAKEHNSNAYVLEGRAGVVQEFEGAAASGTPTLGAPISQIPNGTFTGSVGVQSAVLTWVNASAYSPSTHQIQIYRHTANSVSAATHIATVSGTTFTDKFTQEDAQNTYYYWVRYVINRTFPGADKNVLDTSAYTNKGGGGDGGLALAVPPLNANNIHYGSDGSSDTIETLKPEEANANNTLARLDAGQTVNSGGITFASTPSGQPSLKGGQTGFDSGTGFFLGYDTNAYKLSVGNSSGNKLTFNGTNLSVTGTITASDFQGGTLGQASGASNRIPTTVFSRTVANGKGVPVGSEVGGFVDLTNGHFLFGDANTFISFSPTSDDSSNPARKLTLKGDLEAENLTVTSSISTPLLKVGRLEAGTVRVADIREEVFSEIDSRLGNTGGYYASYETSVGNSDDGYQGEDATAPYVKVLDGTGSGYGHAGETTFLNFALNDQFAAPVSLSTNTAAGRHPNDLQITAKFQKKIAGQADSTYVNVGNVRTFTLTETLIPYATRYTAEFSMSETITTDSSGDATDPNNHISGTSYIYRVVLAAVAQPGGTTYKSYFKTYYDSGGNLEGIGANDQAASPVFFEIREGSIGSSAGNLDTSQFITHTADNDTNIEFLDDKIKLNAGGETMVTLTQNDSSTDTITLHKDTTVSTNLTVSGDLTVTGTTSTLNTADLTVEDKNIVLNYNATGNTTASADGAGITIQDAVDASTDASILWNATEDRFDFSNEVSISTGTASASQFPQLVLKDTNGTSAANQLELGYSGNVFYFKRNDNDGAFHFRKTNNTDVVVFDMDNERVGIGTASPTNKLEVTGGTIIANGGGTFDPDGDGTDTSATVAIAIPSGQRIIGAHNGYIRNLVNFTQSAPIIIGQTGTTLLRGVELHCGTVYGVKIKNSTSSATLTINEDSHISTKSTSVSSTNATVIDSFAHATYRSAKYTIQITQGTKYQTSEIMVIHDGSTPIATEYAMLETNGILGTFDVAISGDNVELSVTMVAADSATVRAVRHSIRV
jgi:hypothetical protein